MLRIVFWCFVILVSFTLAGLVAVWPLRDFGASRTVWVGAIGVPIPPDPRYPWTLAGDAHYVPAHIGQERRLAGTWFPCGAWYSADVNVGGAGPDSDAAAMLSSYSVTQQAEQFQKLVHDRRLELRWPELSAWQGRPIWRYHWKGVLWNFLVNALVCLVAFLALWCAVYLAHKSGDRRSSAT